MRIYCKSRSVGMSVCQSVHHIFEFRAVFTLLLLPNRLRLDCRVSGFVPSLISFVSNGVTPAVIIEKKMWDKAFFFFFFFFGQRSQRGGGRCSMLTDIWGSLSIFFSFFGFETQINPNFEVWNPAWKSKFKPPGPNQRTNNFGVPPKVTNLAVATVSSRTSLVNPSIRLSSYTICQIWLVCTNSSLGKCLQNQN